MMKKCLYCDTSFETKNDKKKYCQYSCCVFAYNLRIKKQTAVLTDEEVNKREELIKIYGGGRNV